jgi:HAD superfamily hydrolase (TIGR01549 family)
MRRFKGVFFDFHGTILLSPDIDGAWENWARAFYSRMKGFGLCLSREGFNVFLKDLFNKPEPEFKEKGMSLFERRVNELCDELGVQVSRPEAKEMIEEIINVWYHDMYIEPQTTSILTELKKRYKIAIITNWEHTPRFYMVLNEMGLDGIFDEIIVSDEVGVSKPDPRIFNIALERTGLEPEEVAYIGDGEIDVLSSMNAGVKPILIKRPGSQGNWFYGSEDTSQNIKSDCVTIIESLEELLHIF